MDENDRLPSPEEFSLLVAEFAAEVAKLFERPNDPIPLDGFEQSRRKLVHAYEQAHRRAHRDSPNS